MFNPAFGVAMAVANNARIAAYQAQQSADEAARRLAALEARLERERREHSWALALVGQGWDPAKAGVEARAETARRNLYELMRPDLARAEHARPRERSRIQYDKYVTSRERTIERWRTMPKFGPHPVVLATATVVGLTGTAWINAGATSAVVRATITGLASLASLVIAFFVYRRSGSLWLRYRVRAVEFVDARAERARDSIPGFSTWRQRAYALEAKSFMKAQGNVAYCRQQLEARGASSVDRALYDSMFGRAKAIVDPVFTRRTELLVEAIEECISYGHIRSARALMSELTPKWVNHFEGMISGRTPVTVRARRSTTPVALNDDISGESLLRRVIRPVGAAIGSLAGARSKARTVQPSSGDAGSRERVVRGEGSAGQRPRDQRVRRTYSKEEKANCQAFTSEFYPESAGAWVSAAEVLSQYGEWCRAHAREQMPDERLLVLLQSIGWRPRESNGRRGFIDRPSKRARERALDRASWTKT